MKDQPGRQDRLLGRGAQASVVGLVGLALMTAAMTWSPSIRKLSGLGATNTARGYSERERIDLPRPIYSGFGTTVVIFGRSSCSACQRAKDVLSRLVEVAGKNGETQVVLMTSVEVSPEELAYASELGIDFGRVFRVSPEDVRVRIIPTVLLIDRAGQILFVREGSLRHDEDQHVMRALERAHKQRG